MCDTAHGVKKASKKNILVFINLDITNESCYSISLNKISPSREETKCLLYTHCSIESVTHSVDSKTLTARLRF